MLLEAHYKDKKPINVQKKVITSLPKTENLMHSPFTPERVCSKEKCHAPLTLIEAECKHEDKYYCTHHHPMTC